MADIGKWAFLLGVLVAIIIGLGLAFPFSGLVLLILGIVVGFLNIEKKVTTNFMVATITLLAVSVAANLTSINELLSPIGTLVDSILKYIVIFVAPAALVVSLKDIYALASK